MHDEQQQSDRLRRKLAAPAPLSFEQAQAQIEALVAAELAGEDVDTTFAAVLQALDRYPALAEQYYALMEDQTAFAAGAEPLAAPATTPTFFPDPGQEAAGVGLWPWGQGLKHLLVRLAPKQAAFQPIEVMSLDTVEYINEWVEHDGQRMQLTGMLSKQADGHWELVVALLSAAATRWQIDATVGDRSLPVLSQDEFEVRFGPLEKIPAEPIVLVLRPQTA